MLEPEVHENVAGPADRGAVADAEFLDDIERVGGDGSAVTKDMAVVCPEGGQRTLDQQRVPGVVDHPHRVEVVEVHRLHGHLPVAPRQFCGSVGGHDWTLEARRITDQVANVVEFSPCRARTTSAMSRTDSSTRYTSQIERASSLAMNRSIDAAESQTYTPPYSPLRKRR